MEDSSHQSKSIVENGNRKSSCENIEMLQNGNISDTDSSNESKSTILNLDCDTNSHLLNGNIKHVTNANGYIEDDIDDDDSIAKDSTTYDVKKSSDDKNETKCSESASSSSEGSANKDQDQEVVFIQDLGFTIKILSPGVEPFDIQVSTRRCHSS